MRSHINEDYQAEPLFAEDRYESSLKNISDCNISIDSNEDFEDAYDVRDVGVYDDFE